MFKHQNQLIDRFCTYCGKPSHDVPSCYRLQRGGSNNVEPESRADITGLTTFRQLSLLSRLRLLLPLLMISPASLLEWLRACKPILKGMLSSFSSTVTSKNSDVQKKLCIEWVYNDFNNYTNKILKYSIEQLYSQIVFPT